MKRNLLFLSLLGSSLAIHAQSLTTVTGLRLYEHHSSSMNNGAPFGSGANGSKSAYDFVNRTFFNSFNAATFGAYTNGEEANIDMVEHNGGFGNGGKFGVTSAVSSIWGGDIKGNNTTLWMEAPANFNYATVNNVSQIVAVFNENAATKSITEVMEGKVYLGRIRNTNLYVAMRTYNIKNAAGMGGIQDVYFDFDYKYAKHTPTGIEDVAELVALTISPNPAADHIVLKNTVQQAFSAKIVSAYGQEVRSFSLAKDESQPVDISGISSGIYFVICTLKDGHSYTHKFVKH